MAPAEEDFTSISEMADRLGLEGDERSEYVTEHMSRFGYKPRTVWDDGDEEEEDPNVKRGFFPKKTAAKKTQGRSREVPQGKQPYGYGS